MAAPDLHKLNSRTRIARQLYIFEGVWDVKQLAKQSGAAERTIRDSIPRWTDEREIELRNRGLQSDGREAGQLVRALSGEIVSFNASDTQFLRDQTTNLRQNIENLTKTASSLLELAAKSSEPEQVSQLVRDYIASEKVRGQLTDRWLRVQKHWRAISGLDDRDAAGKAYANTLASTKAKSDAAEASKPEEKAPALPSAKVFDLGES